MTLIYIFWGYSHKTSLFYWIFDTPFIYIFYTSIVPKCIWWLLPFNFLRVHGLTMWFIDWFDVKKVLKAFFLHNNRVQFLDDSAFSILYVIVGTDGIYECNPNNTSIYPWLRHFGSE